MFEIVINLQDNNVTCHDFELPVAFAALPLRHQMQKMHALVALSFFLALGAGELDLADGEERLLGLRVDELHEARVEVDLGGQRGDRDEARPVWEGLSGQFRTANGRNWPGTNFEFVVVQNFGPPVQIQNFWAVQNLIFFFKILFS